MSAAASLPPEVEVSASDPGDDAALRTFLLVAEGAFPHESHLRVARLYLQQRSLGHAIDSFAFDLRRFATAAGAPGKYHHTLTVAFLLLIRSRLALAPDGETFEAFLRRNPDLGSSRCLARFYSEALLASDVARRDFVFPDLGAGATSPSLPGLHEATCAAASPGE